MSLIPPAYFDAVCAIGERDSDEKLKVLATGFLYGRLSDPSAAPRSYITFLITNRHVVEGKSKITVRFNTTGETPSHVYDVSLLDEGGTPIYSVHPDPDVDIAAVSFSVGVLRMANIKCYFFESDGALTLRAAADSGVAEGNGVFLLGFPLGDAGTDRNYVVARHGIIARMSDAVAGASKHFLADVAVFPGSSGSPLVTKPEIVAITGTKAHSRSVLVGIVAKYMTYTDVAISAQTKHARITFEENSGLAIVYPVDQIAIVVDLAHAAYQARIAKEAATVGNEPHPANREENAVEGE